MKTVSAFALAAVLAVGSTGAYAQSVFESLASDATPSTTTALSPIEAISRNTASFTIVTVSAADAKFLRYDTDVDSIRKRIVENRFASTFIANSGVTVDQVVGARADDRNNVTLFVVS